MSMDAGTKFRNEILAVFYRYSQEADLTVYTALGALEVAKHNILGMMDRHLSKSVANGKCASIDPTQSFQCSLPPGHTGAHENGGVQWGP